MCQIVKNAARCHECDEEVESKTRWDFVSCKCNAIFVDGGREYLRRGFMGSGDMSNYLTDTSVFKDCMSNDCRYKDDVVTNDCG